MGKITCRFHWNSSEKGEWLREGKRARERRIEQAERILFETNLKLKNRYKVI